MSRPVLLVVSAVLLAGVAALLWNRNPENGFADAPSGPPAVPAPGAEATASAPAAAVETAPFDPRAAAEAEAPPAPAAAEPGGVTITGKILDGRRRPAAGVEVEFRAEDRKPVRGRSGPDGRFRLMAGPRPGRAARASVHASGGDGRSAWATPEFGPASPVVLDAGVLVLAAGHPLSILVTAGGTPVAGARVFVTRAEWLRHLAILDAGADGIVEEQVFPPGDYVLTAFSPAGARGDVSVDLSPAAPARVEIRLAPAWDLRVRVQDAAGAPVTGVRLDATFNIRSERGISVLEPTLPEALLPTDGAGISVIRGLPREHPLNVAAHPDADRGPFRRARERQLVRGTAKPGDEELVLAIPAGRTFRFPLGTGEVPPPSEGTPLRLSLPDGFGGAPPPPRGTIVANEVVIEGASESCTNILATAPDGSLAILRLLGDAKKTGVGAEAVFKKPRTLAVTAKDRAGRPLAAWITSLRTPGNIQVGSEAALDADGAARIDGLFPQRVNVRMRRPGSAEWSGMLVGLVDLGKEEISRLDVTVESERSALVRVRIDGAPGLPSTFDVRLTGADRGPIEEDSGCGELRFPFRPETTAERITLHFTAGGHPAVECRLDLPPDPAVVEASVDLVTGARLHVRVLSPADGIHQVALQAWSEAERNWRPGPGRLGGPQGLQDDRRTELDFDSLPAGRYRVRDGMSGLVSAPLDLAAGAAQRLTLDLSRAGPITGKVVAPEGGNVGRARVFVEGDGLHRPGDAMGLEDGIRVTGAGGEFKVRVPGDRPVTLRAWHPLLSPSPDRGTAIVTAPRDGVELVLVQGPEGMVRLAEAPPDSQDHMPRHRLLLFAGDAEKPREHPVLFQDGIGRFGGFTPGRYRIWCDLPPHAPLELPDVQLGAGTTDLGVLRPGPGASVRLTVLTRPGQEPPRMEVSARHLGQPWYWRSGSHSDPAGALIRGLGPGRFSVSIRQGGDFRPAGGDLEVVSDGRAEIPLTLDLR